MDNLKLFCIFFCVLSLVGAFTGIHGVHWSYRGGPPAQSTLAVSRAKGLGPALFSTAWALALASAAYGIHRKARVVWMLGWGVLSIVLFSIAVQALSFVLNQTGPDRWIESAAFLAGGVGLTVYWGFWWKRQKGYFGPGKTAP